MGRRFLFVLAVSLFSGMAYSATIHVPADQPTMLYGVKSAPDIEWEKTYGNSQRHDYPMDMIQCPDSSLIFLGRTITSQGSNDIYIVKTDKDGDTLWSRIYGLPDREDMGNSIKMMADSGLIICGSITIGSKGNWDIYILKLNANGDSLWSRAWGSQYNEGAESIIESFDGSYIIAGYKSEPGNPIRGFIEELDSVGSPIWSKYIGNPDESSFPEHMVKCADSGFIIAGAFDSTGTGAYGYPMLCKYDKIGNLQWLQTYPIIDQDTFRTGKAIHVCESSSGGFVYTGFEYSPNGRTNLIIYAVNPNGNLSWRKIFDGNMSLIGQSIEPLYEFGYLVSASRTDIQDIHLYKIDSSGNIVWIQVIDRGPYESAKKAIQTFDGGYIVAGDTRSSIDENFDILGIKFHSVLPGIGSFTIDGKDDLSRIINHTPEFGWSIISPYIGISDSIAIEIGADDDWQAAELWTTGVLQYEDTSIIYNGAILTDGLTYYFRMRVAENNYWSPWFSTTFRMNSIPTVPIPITPIDSQIVSSVQPFLYLHNSTDLEGDTITYEYFGFSDSAFGDLIPFGAVGIAQGADSTGWQVDSALHENWKYWWKARAFDGYEYSDWSERRSFWINAVEEPPTPFTLSSPPDTSGGILFDMLTSYTWTSSSDPDPFDSVHYTLYVALDSNFIYVQTVDSIYEPHFTLTDSLWFATKYWWKVKATDKTGLHTNSTHTLNFRTWKLGDANGDWNLNALDVTFLINSLYKHGPKPNPLKVGDINGSCTINALDITYLINYLYKSGNVPRVGCE